MVQMGQSANLVKNVKKNRKDKLKQPKSLKKSSVVQRLELQRYNNFTFNQSKGFLVIRLELENKFSTRSLALYATQAFVISQSQWTNSSIIHTANASYVTPGSCCSPGIKTIRYLDGLINSLHLNNTYISTQLSIKVKI